MTISQFGERCGDFVFNNMGWFVVGGILFVAALIGLAAVGQSRAYDRFMTECLYHRPQYECTAMWRAGNQSGGTHVQPVIVPVR